MAASCNVTQPPALARETDQTDRYELVLLNGAGTHVLLLSGKGTDSLAMLRIPRFTRPAEQITSLVKREWGISAVLLWLNHCESQESEYSAVLEVIDDVRGMSPLVWNPIHKVLKVVGKPQRDLIESCVAKATKMCFGLDPEPFSRLGWMSRLKNWIQPFIQPSGIVLEGFTQLNGSETFSLLRFETDKRPLWFKAVGAPNLHEFRITLLLSQFFPEFVPRVLGSNSLLNGWLMEQAGESTLRESTDVASWLQTVRRLAELQIRSLPKTKELLQAGCRDSRVTVLRQLVKPFFEVMAGFMRLQTKTDPAPLGAGALSELAADIESSLNLLEQLQIPVSLGHGDCGPGNIIVGQGSCAFIDWAEAHVGCPFLTVEYLLAHLRKSGSPLVPLTDDFRGAYAQAWASVLRRTRVDGALRVSPLIAAYAHAALSPSWRDPDLSALPRVPPYFRSMVRTMKRAADSFKLGSAACPQ